MGLIADWVAGRGLVDVRIEDIGSLRDPEPESKYPLIRSNAFKSGELQRQCQEILLARMDAGKPLIEILSNRILSQTAANIILALSHPCPRHVDLFAYCREFFEDGEGGLKNRSRTIDKLNWLFDLNLLNLAKVVKLHGGEYDLYQLNQPLHLGLCRIAVLNDDAVLANLLISAEDSSKDAFVRYQRHQYHHLRAMLIGCPWRPDSAVRALLLPNERLSHSEIHARVMRFLAPIAAHKDHETHEYLDLATPYRHEYVGEKPSLSPKVEFHSALPTVGAVLELPGFDGFLKAHSMAILKEMSVNPAIGNRVLSPDQEQLLVAITQAALNAGNPSEDIYFPMLASTDRYRLEDMKIRGVDLKERWISASLDLHGWGNHTSASKVVIRTLLAHEGMEVVTAYPLTDEQLLAARDLTSDDAYLNGASSKARDLVFSEDLGL